MKRLFEYLDNEIYCHHTLDTEPDPSGFSLHVHEHMELLYILSGKGQYLAEGSYYPLCADVLVLARSAEAHQVIISPDMPYERISITFDASIIRGIDPEGYLLRPLLNRPLGFHNCYTPDSVANQNIRALYHAFDYEGSHAQKRIHIIRVLLAVLLEISNEFGSITASGYLGGNTVAQELIHYINEELFNNLSLSIISKRFYLSESQINRIFKDATGTTIWEYVRTKRLLAAREKILAGESISSASSCCGFQDYSVFFRAYKSRFGIAPSETLSHKNAFPNRMNLSE